MALSTVASGSQTAVLGTDHTLTTQTTAASLVLLVNTVNLVNGEIVEVWVRTKVLTGDAVATVYYASYSHAQASPIKISPPVSTMFSIEAHLKQTGGTGRVFSWSLLQL